MMSNGELQHFHLTNYALTCPPLGGLSIFG